MTTQQMLDAVAWGRAPGGRINKHILCADGFTVSVQASPRHYARDASGRAPYWSADDDPEISWPFVEFEVGYPSESPEPADVWAEYDSGGVWAWVPRQIVSNLLDRHGGAIEWTEYRRDT